MPLVAGGIDFTSGKSGISTGADTRITIPYAAALNSEKFTVEAVCAPSDTIRGTYGTPYGSRGTNRGYNLYANNAGAWSMWTGDGVTWVKHDSPTSNVVYNKKARVVGLHDGVTGRLYVDGAQTFEANSGYVPLESGSAAIGANDGGVAWQFAGVIYSIRVWDRVLSADEVANLENGVVPRDGLVGEWIMDNVRGNHAPDTSGHGHHGTLSGTPRDKLKHDAGGLILDGVASSYASAPDSEALRITGDIILQGKVALDDWTPPSQATVAAKYNGTNKDYLLTISPSGALQLYRGDGAGGAQVVSSSANIALNNGEFLWVRGTHRVSDHRVQFFTSPDRLKWTKLGNDVTLPAIVPGASNASLEIGTWNNGIGSRLEGRIQSVQIYDGLEDTEANLVFDGDFTGPNPVDRSPNAAVITLNGGARMAATSRIIKPSRLSGTNGLTATGAAFDFLDYAPFTYEAVLTMHSIAPSNVYPRVFMHERSGGGTVGRDGWNLIVNAAGISSERWSDGSGISASAPRSRDLLNRTSRLTTRFDGTNIALFLNGVLLDSRAVGARPITASGEPLYMDYGNLDATVHETRVWKRALSDREIQLGNAPRDGLVGEWLWDVGIGNSVPDMSGSGHDAVLTSGASWSLPISWPNLCPPFEYWTLEDGAYLEHDDGETILVLPYAGAQAVSPLIDVKAASNYRLSWDHYAEEVNNTSDPGYSPHINTQYLDEGGSLTPQGNGWTGNGFEPEHFDRAKWVRQSSGVSIGYSIRYVKIIFNIADPFSSPWYKIRRPMVKTDRIAANGQFGTDFIPFGGYNLATKR